MQINFVAEFHRQNASFTRETASYSVSEPPFAGSRLPISLVYNGTFLSALMTDALMRRNWPLLKG